MRASRCTPVCAGALATACAALAFAGSTRSFRQTTAKDFEDGEATASMILPTGDVVPGMKTGRLGVEAAFVWCALLARDGRTAYFGTGDQGRIYAVGAVASEAAGPPRKLAELDVAWVTSLAQRPDGTLLAGATPGGRIFTVNPQSGAVHAFAKLAAEHVWALAHDAKTGATYVAAGNPGKVFAVDGKGAPRVLWDSGDKHVVSLVDGGAGTLLAGTAEQAVVYRIRADGRAEALHDFEADEVRALQPAGKAIYLAVNDFEPPGEALPPPAAGSAPPVAKGTSISLGGTPLSAGTLPRPGQVKAKGAVYRLEEDGQIEQIAALADGYFTALLAEPGGAVYAAAGTQGKIYRLSPDRTVALAADLPERQALALVRTGHGFLVGSGDIGGVFWVRQAVPGEASYLSKVFDAEVPARWGKLRFSGSEGVSFETRAGHTAKPDKSWSDFEQLARPSLAGAEGEGQVASRPARYLQYRASLRDKASVLREVTLYYLPQNQRARVTDLSLGDGGAPAPAAAHAHSSTLKLRWKLENPDNDELIYRLSYRPEGEKIWRTLGGPEPLGKPEYDWNTESVPDGRYVVRIWASDENVTPRDRALDFTYDAPALLVDNTKPEVRDLSARPPLVTGNVRDQASPISQIEYSIDGNEWRPAAPVDGLLDERAEAFSLRLPALQPGPHVLTVRAFDATYNLGSARLTVQIPKP